MAEMFYQVTAFEGTQEAGTTRGALLSGQVRCSLPGAVFSVALDIQETGFISGSGRRISGKTSFRVESGMLAAGNVAVGLTIPDFSRKDYVFAPGAVYDGNRFHAVKRRYPPMFHPEDGAGPDMETMISDVPRLSDENQNSQFHLLSGDLATPCLGVYQREAARGILFYGPHNTAAGYTGFRYRENGRTAEFELSAPGVRHHAYANCSTDGESEDIGYRLDTGTVLDLPFQLLVFPCPSIATFFQMFFETRKCMNTTHSWHHELPFSAAFDRIEQKYLDSQWNDEQAYWRIAPGSGRFNDWQAGWVGGGINAYALGLDGSGLARDRSDQTFDTIFSRLQSENGYIYPIMYQGKLLGDNFIRQDDYSFLLLRKNADVLYFACKYMLNRVSKSPPAWEKGIRSLADVFVRLWDRYGQLGQFVDIRSETILAGGTCSAAIAVAGLSLASVLTGEDKYRGAAEGIATYYIDHYLNQGVMNGGPGDILQNPDSESAFGFLEGLACLYNLTRDRKWIPAMESCAWQCASWCVSYDFHFPEASEFGRLDLHTVGSIFANVQNKHSAPGICTLSPTALLELYRHTGKKAYLELARDIAHNISQYLSRDDRPIHSWDGKALPSGWMCERVNMSDWEGKHHIGGVFYGSCWCEISCMLTYVEMPGVYFRADTGELAIFDHVDVNATASHADWILTITNPTAYSLRLKLVVDGGARMDLPWPKVYAENMQQIFLQSGIKTVFVVKKEVGS